MTLTALARLLRLDGAANLAGAVALALLAAPLRDALGLAASWPLLAVAGLLLVNGIECLLVAGDPRRVPVTALAGVDLAFAAAVLGVALLGLPGAAGWARAVLFVAATGSALVGLAKLAGRRGVPAVG
jgi:hypothetical protein